MVLVANEILPVCSQTVATHLAMLKLIELLFCLALDIASKHVPYISY